MNSSFTIYVDMGETYPLTKTHEKNHLGDPYALTHGLGHIGLRTPVAELDPSFFETSLPTIIARFACDDRRYEKFEFSSGSPQNSSQTDVLDVVVVHILTQPISVSLEPH